MTETMMWYVERDGDPMLRRAFQCEDLAQEYAHMIDRIRGEEVTRLFAAPVTEMIDRVKPVEVVNRERLVGQCDRDLLGVFLVVLIEIFGGVVPYL